MEGNLAVGKFGKFIAKHMAEENLVNFVHSQTKNYEMHVIRRNSSVNVPNEQLQRGSGTCTHVTSLKRITMQE